MNDECDLHSSKKNYLALLLNYVNDCFHSLRLTSPDNECYVTIKFLNCLIALF